MMATSVAPSIPAKRRGYSGHQVPRSRRPETTHRPPSFVLARVSAPFRAEHPKKKLVGAHHEHIEDALKDARAMGVGARVFSSEGILLAKCEHAARYADIDLDRATGRESFRRPGRPSKKADEEEPQ